MTETTEKPISFDPSNCARHAEIVERYPSASQYPITMGNQVYLEGRLIKSATDQYLDDRGGFGYRLETGGNPNEKATATPLNLWIRTIELAPASAKEWQAPNLRVESRRVLIQGVEVMTHPVEDWVSYRTSEGFLLTWVPVYLESVSVRREMVESPA